MEKKKKNKDKRLVRKPTFFGWVILGFFVVLIFKLKIKSKVIFKDKLRKKSLVLAPHRNYMDFIIVPIIYYPNRGHFVSTSYWYRNKKLGKFLDWLGCIKKDQYKSDVNAIKEMSDCFKRGDLIYMFPEGQMSMDGKSQELSPGLEKLIKKFKLNVYVCNPNGSYLSGPKWHGKLIKGRIETECKLIIKEEDIDNLSTKDIYDITYKAMNENNDFEWFRKHPDYKFKSKKKAEGLEKVVFSCPKCGGSHLTTKNSTLMCDCGLNLEFEKNNYNFKENEYFKDLEGLLEYENNIVREDIKNNVVYENNATIISYETLDPKELTYKKVRMDNEKIEFLNEDNTDIMSFDLKKIINFVITLGKSFEVPTPEATYRLYLDNGVESAKYWSRIRYIKEENESNNQ